MKARPYPRAKWGNDLMGDAPSEGLLTPEEYQLIAAPALQTAAQLAAQRGDPKLYNDMPSMLALLGMVSGLTHAYLQQAPPPFPATSARSALESAPLAVCALVFTESGLEASQVQGCLRALSSAYLQLLHQGVLGPQEAYVEKAFQQFLAGERPGALQSLRQAASSMARAVDGWESARI
jgi:hypothetical protein